VLTALLLAPIVIGAVLWLPTPRFALFAAAVVLLGAWEWSVLAGLPGRLRRAAYLSVVAVSIMIHWRFPEWQVWLLTAGALWWILQAVLLSRVSGTEPVEGLDARLLPIGLVVLVPPWVALVCLHSVPDTGPASVLFLLLLVWTADIAAYFVGRRWGTTKLAPALSPGKTRAGVYGALVGAFVCGLVFGWYLSFGVAGTLVVALVCAVAAAASVVGDLYESLLKRRRGIKDSGQLLPGHGGLLDRIDSMTAAAPVLALGLAALGVGP